MAVMASTIGTARGRTQGSCRPFAVNDMFSPCILTVCCGCRSVATGLNATLK